MSSWRSRLPLPEKRAFTTPESAEALERRLTSGAQPGAGYACRFEPLQADESQRFSLVRAGRPPGHSAYVEGRVRPGPQGARVELRVVPGFRHMLSFGLAAVFVLSGLARLPSLANGLPVLLAGVVVAGVQLGLFTLERARLAQALARLFPGEDWR